MSPDCHNLGGQYLEMVSIRNGDEEFQVNTYSVPARVTNPPQKSQEASQEVQQMTATNMNLNAEENTSFASAKRIVARQMMVKKSDTNDSSAPAYITSAVGGAALWIA